MITEIGSEFWLEEATVANKVHIPEWLLKFGDITLTSSGRGAISLLLEQVIPKSKTALLPSYICESVIQPFIKSGYKCRFYDINADLSPNIISINKYSNMGVFLHIGYFGFQTNKNIEVSIKELRESGTIIIEDITHTLFSDFKYYKGNDFYIGSIRKWFGIPSAGFLASKQKSLIKSKNQHSKFTKLRLEGLTTKAKFMENQDNESKEKFLYMFNEAERILDKDVKPYKIDDISLGIISSLKIKDLIKKRRENFKFLIKGLRTVNCIKLVFGELDDYTCPLFCPVYVKGGRNEIRSKLAKNKIYCPIHWSLANDLKGRISKETEKIYNSILSLPCDQRYRTKDMERIIKEIKHLF